MAIRSESLKGQKWKKSEKKKQKEKLKECEILPENKVNGREEYMAV